ncbi:MAG TPA: cohesin domain-containing protein [Gemmatimonadales bacterium]|nr:cohesin domain-containing protein [Gemmatimonadales bacterium]
MTVRLEIVPEFDRTDGYVATAIDADSLRVRIVRADSAGAFTDTVVRATVRIDPDSGTVNASFSVVLLQSPQNFRVVLAAIRSSDGAVLFSGASTVQVSSGPGSAGGQQVSIPVSYTGPRARRLVLAPRDTAVTAGSSFVLRATAFDSLGAVVNVAARFALVTPGDSTKLRVNRLTGLVTTVANQTGAVLVYGYTPDTAATDTARVYLGAVPAAVRVTPGFAGVVPTGTTTLTGQVVDASGNPVAGTSVSWVSRSTGVATVSGTGVVTGVAVGNAVVVASGSGFSDSALVSVLPATNVLVSSTSSGRAFRAARVGDTVVVDITADMAFAPGERLGSYNARLTWDAAVLQYVSVVNTTFAAPTVNADSVSAGKLRFASADANGAAGQVVVARVRLRAIAAGTTSPALTISELSAASPTFTNLLSRVTVASGSVTVRP